MDIFNSKKSYIGVDLGTSAVKMVELQNKGGRALLLTYGYVEQPTDIIRSSSQEMESKIVSIIKTIHKDSRMCSKKVIAALPSFSVFSSIINLPLMNKKDLAQAVKWEAKKFVPLPIEEMTLDWKIIPENTVLKESGVKKNNNNNQAAISGQNHNLSLADKDNHGGESTKGEIGRIKGQLSQPVKEKAFSLSKLTGFLKKGAKSKNKLAKKSKDNIKVLLTAAPKNLVEKYLRIFKAAELELLSLETEAFALERSLTGSDPAPVMIIDIGAVSSDITIINNGIPILTRSIDVGGTAITKALMTNLNVDLARAEQFKRDIGFSPVGQGGLPEIIKNTVNPIVNEVKYSLDIYLSQSGSPKALEKIILTGGSAYLPELVKYLSKLLDIKVIIGDPWDKVVYPLELKPVLAELGPRFAVSVGLAMREI